MLLIQTSDNDVPWMWHIDYCIPHLLFFSKRNKQCKLMKHLNAAILFKLRRQVLLGFCWQSAASLCAQVLLGFCRQSAHIACQQALSTEHELNADADGYGFDVGFWSNLLPICAHVANILLTGYIYIPR